jgi:hypothetical protein
VVVFKRLVKGRGVSATTPILMSAKNKKQEGEMVLTAQFRRAFVIGALGASIATIGTFAASSARAENSDDARAILKAMSDYIAGQKSIAATFNSDIEVITPDLQKIQFDSSGRSGSALDSAELTAMIQSMRDGLGYGELRRCFNGSQAYADPRMASELSTRMAAA